MQKTLFYSILIVFLVVSITSFSIFVSSVPPPEPALQKQRFYNFVIQMPEEVATKAGDAVIVKGNVTNLGMWWIRQFNLTIDGLPYDYEIIPNYFEELRILRDWNPKQGVFRTPQKFELRIYLPSNATGAHLITVKGQENFSWRKVANSTTLILKVEPLVPIRPNITVSDIAVPEQVFKNKPFDINFTINNNNIFSQAVNVTVEIPSDWSALEMKKSFIIEANKSADVSFVVVPSDKSGNISVFLEYPFKQNIFNLTKVGPLLTPVSEIIPEINITEVPAERPISLPGIIEFIKGLSPIVIAIIILIFAVIAYNLIKIISFYRARKKTEGK